MTEKLRNRKYKAVPGEAVDIEAIEVVVRMENEKRSTAFLLALAMAHPEKATMNVREPGTSAPRRLPVPGGQSLQAINYYEVG